MVGRTSRVSNADWSLIFYTTNALLTSQIKKFRKICFVYVRVKKNSSTASDKDSMSYLVKIISFAAATFALFSAAAFYYQSLDDVSKENKKYASLGIYFGQLLIILATLYVALNIEKNDDRTMVQ